MTAAAAVTPAAALRDAVEAMFTPGDRVAATSDSHSYVDRVLLAIRLPDVAFVMSIPRAEYDGIAVLRVLGFDMTPTPLPPPLPPRRFDSRGVPLSPILQDTTA